MDWLTLGGSIAAVLIVAGLVWLMGLGKALTIADAEQAKRLAGEAHSGFAPVEAIVDKDGKAALVAGTDGTMILLRAHGAQIAARVFRSPPDMERRDGMLTINTGERSFGDVTLTVGEQESARWTEISENPHHA